MLRLLKFLVTGSWHQHKWEIIAKALVNGDDPDAKEKWIRYDLQCTGCGDVKKKDMD